MRTLDSIVDGGRPKMYTVEWHDVDGMLTLRILINETDLETLKREHNIVAEGGETAVVVTITPMDYVINGSDNA